MENMKNHFTNVYTFLREILIDDICNRYLLLSTFTLSFLSYIIWNKYLSHLDVYVIPKIEVFPVKFLAVILLINTALGLFSYFKEKEITYLLFIGSLLVSIFVLILETFYLLNLN